MLEQEAVVEARDSAQAKRKACKLWNIRPFFTKERRIYNAEMCEV
ncbi:hypothetical protein [Thermoanaerobacter thermohydrosulfuricus]|nr:hypothetical protein [Thermoanaerobacter thermohydrosulfuricus]